MARRKTQEQQFQEEVRGAALQEIVREVVDDPRIDRCKKHPLVNILFIALCSIICGGRTFVEMEAFGEARRQWLARFIDLSNGIPSHDTFARVLSMLCPNQVFKALRQWTAHLAMATGHGQLAIDAKAIRRALKLGTPHALVHVVSAWSCRLEQVVAIEPIDKSGSEQDAVEMMLRFLELKGLLVTLDAGHCHKKVAKQITDKGGEYLLTVKGNQPSLHGEIEELLTPHLDDEAMEHSSEKPCGSSPDESNQAVDSPVDAHLRGRPTNDSDDGIDVERLNRSVSVTDSSAAVQRSNMPAATDAACDGAQATPEDDGGGASDSTVPEAGVAIARFETRERGHGRDTWWRCVVVRDVEHLRFARQWPNVTAVAAIRRRSVDRHGKETTGTRYYITSMTDPSPKRIYEAVRRHWQVENCVHWQLDVSFGEDACAARALNAAAVVGAVRRTALNMIRAAKPPRTSVRTLAWKAAMDSHVLTQILVGSQASR